MKKLLVVLRVLVIAFSMGSIATVAHATGWISCSDCDDCAVQYFNAESDKDAGGYLALWTFYGCNSNN